MPLVIVCIQASRFHSSVAISQRRQSVLNLGEVQDQNQVRLIVFSSPFPLKIDNQSQNQVSSSLTSLHAPQPMCQNMYLVMLDAEHNKF